VFGSSDPFNRAWALRTGRDGSLTLISRVAYALLFALAGLSPAGAQQACPDPYSARGACTPITASATGSTGAIAATIPAVASKTAYLCGFYYTGTNATAANTATQVTVTGLNGGTMPFGFPTLALAATVPNTIPIDEAFLPCLAATSVNSPIVVNGPALGAGATQATVTAWGYYL
jgi:hypothetical protein